MDVGFAFCASITICLIVIPLFLAANHKQENTPYYSLIGLSLTTAIYQWFSWQYYEATTLPLALEQLKLQTAAVFFLPPFLFYCIAKWTQFKHRKLGTIFMAVVTIACVVINYFSDFSFRFSELRQISVELPFNGVNSENIVAERSFVSSLHFIYGIFIIFWSASRIQYFLKHEKTVYAFCLSLFIFTLLLSVFWGVLIDEGSAQNIYLAGFSFTLLLFMLAINIAYQVKVKNRELTVQSDVQNKIEQAMVSLAQGISNSANLNFYDNTTLNIQKLFQTKFAFIGLYHQDQLGERIETISVVCDGDLVPNFDYLLADTPCNDVVGNALCTYENNVDLLFPKDTLLKDMNIKSYVGLPLFNTDTKPVGIVVLLDESEYKIPDDFKHILDVFGSRIGAELSRDSLSKKLRQTAYFDYTTRLPNRARLFEEIGSLFKKDSSVSQNFILMLIDLDRFKDVNRVHGYDAANEVLKEVGNRLKLYARESIFVARNDGDEFAVLISNLENEPNRLIDIHWQAVSAIIKAPMFIHNKEIKIECSSGAVIFPEQTTDKYGVLRSAESALQEAKYNGRNQCALFDPNIQEAFDRKQKLLVLLKEALDLNEQLFMVYQPQTNNNGKLIGAEALLRWIHPNEGFISPGEFIPIIEETELVHSLGFWVIQSVFKQIQAWEQASKQVPEHISINIAAKQLSAYNFVDSLMKSCRKFDIAPSQIVLELTESGLLVNIDGAIETMKRLQSLGFKIALDDFGTGYSSLSYLKKLPIDILKIDKSFTDDIAIPSTKQLIQSVISIGQHLNLDIIAEGTEEIEQVNQYVAIGCCCFQGYYFSKPLPADELLEWSFNSSFNS